MSGSARRWPFVRDEGGAKMADQGSEVASFQDKEMASGAHFDLIDGGSRQTRLFELLQVPYPTVRCQ